MRKYYHLIGIGGIGMSALACILLKKGEKVTGSDLYDSSTISSLKKLGADIFIGHSVSNIQNPSAVVYSTDIPEDNVEMRYCKDKKIPLMHRSELLASVMKNSTPILIAGTHGKTTTASLLVHVLLESGLDPSFAIGGYLKGINTNGYYGAGQYFAAEADESDGSFLNYPSFGGIITNLEEDHMVYWKDSKTLHNAFMQFASKIGSKEHLLWCKDDARLKALQLKGYSYGFDETADLFIENFQQEGWISLFDFKFQGKHYKEVEIPLIGAHNVQNAAAVFGIALKLDLDEEKIRSSLKTFAGVGRRIEKKGAVNGIEIYDDYAHHPTEIFATLRALKAATKGKKRVIVAFQPHRYSRTKACMDDFADAFEYADQLILTDIYSAREAPLATLTPELLMERIKKGGYHNVAFAPFQQLDTFLASYLESGDLLVTMGAGDITKIGPKVLQRINEK